MPSDSSARSVLNEIERTECLRLIAPGGIGRVAFDDGEGPTVIPVNYTVDGESIVFRTSESARMNRSLLSSVPGGEVRVAFEVDRIDEATQQGWSVLLRGGAHPLSEEERESTAPVEPWPAGHRGAWFSLHATEISGRRLHRR
ncbi:pyridoxamine 5'-phosphate oxidase family protein [Actinomadura sediminis]|uniref:Pyridoxamine 5'-phosphate oxidase family protein n=1 Tax=Actinomadura sediminis TaxID=1038904 RepID=A0ABW3ELT9_9ACTN